MAKKVQKNRGSRIAPASFYTMWDVAKKLNVSRNTMRKYIDKGDFSTVLPDIHHKIIKIGTNYLMPKPLFDLYLKRGMFWHNTNKYGTAGRPKKWIEGEYKHFNLVIPVDLKERFEYALVVMNRNSFVKISKNDAMLLALEEFINRRLLTNENNDIVWNNKAPTPKRYPKDEIGYIKFRIPNVLGDKIDYVVSVYRVTDVEGATKADTINMAIEEFIERRPDLSMSKKL